MAEEINEYKKKSPKELQELKKYIEEQLKPLAATKRKEVVFTGLQETARKYKIIIKDEDKTILRDMDFYSFLKKFDDNLGQQDQVKQDLTRWFNRYKEIINLEEQLKQINNHILLWGVAGDDYKELANEIASLNELLISQQKPQPDLKLKPQKEEAFLAVNSFVYGGEDLKISDFGKLKKQITNTEEIKKCIIKINELRNQILKEESAATKNAGISNNELQKLSVEQLLMLRSEFKKTHNVLRSNSTNEKGNLLANRFDKAITAIEDNIKIKEEKQVKDALNVLINDPSKKWIGRVLKTSKTVSQHDKEIFKKQIEIYRDKGAFTNETTALENQYDKLTQKQQEKFNKILEVSKMGQIMSREIPSTPHSSDISANRDNQKLKGRLGQIRKGNKKFERDINNLDKNATTRITEAPPITTRVTKAPPITTLKEKSPPKISSAKQGIKTLKRGAMSKADLKAWQQQLNAGVSLGQLGGGAPGAQQANNPEDNNTSKKKTTTTQGDGNQTDSHLMAYTENMQTTNNSNQPSASVVVNAENNINWRNYTMVDGQPAPSKGPLSSVNKSAKVAKGAIPPLLPPRNPRR